MARKRNNLVYALTRAIHRFYPAAPVLEHWPGAGRVGKHVRFAVARRVLPVLAARHRRRLHRTTFIAIVGSTGKTMTKFMLGAVLRTRLRGTFRENSANFERTIPESILMARRSDEFCIVELSAGQGPGSLRSPLAMVRPKIGVVTCIASDHRAAFGSEDAIALEKGRLVRELPRDGVAVLNADDPRVMAMRADCRARVLSYGLSADAEVRAEGVGSIWPDRLSFTLLYGGERAFVQTRLCGTHYASGALAAAAAGIAMGIPLDEIARALGTVEPYVARLSILPLADGITVIRDDYKASIHTLPPAFEFLRTARARRKIAIIGTISDYPGSVRTHYTRTARHALEVADFVMFVGPQSSVSLRARPADAPDRLRTFSTVKAAAAFCADFLQPDDFVLLKGSNEADHLYRIVLSRTMNVTCWREKCGRRGFCDACELVSTPSNPAPTEGPTRPAVPDVARQAVADAGAIVVGLGNLGEKYVNTPHNAGHAVVEKIARECGATWLEAADAMVAPVEWRNLSLCLVKTRLMNRSGDALRALFEPAGIQPARIVLVFDDTAMPLGKVRARMRGSDGGHRGVRSILESFQTDRIPRVKIGVSREAGHDSKRDAVLSQFDEAENRLIEPAIELACARLHELVRSC